MSDVATVDQAHPFGPDWSECSVCGRDYQGTAPLCERCAAPSVFEPAGVEQGRRKRKQRAARRQASAREGTPVPPEDAVTKKLTVVELVGAFTGAVDEIRLGFERVRRAELMIDAAFGSGISVQDKWQRVNFTHPEESIANVERIVWGMLVGHLEIGRFMSIRARDQLDKQLKDGDLPPLTVDNVRAMAEGFRGQMRAMLEEAVNEVFEWLRPPRSRYRTNSELEVPPKVCLESCVDQSFGGGIQPRYWREPHLTALENVFHALDGRGQRTKSHYSELSQAIRSATSAPVGWVGETDLFSFRAFKNGSLHLTFKRPDLLARFNQIAGGARLRPGPSE